jgi:hypothetical protein
LILILVVVGLIWWRQRDTGPSEEEQQLQEQMELEQQVDEFLQERGIELPEGSDRANLRDVTGGAAAGVVIRQVGDMEAEYTVIGALPAPESGWYEAWLVSDNRILDMGRMREGKGGYVVDFSTTEDVSGLDQVQVSQEIRVTEQPTEILLEGSF